MKNLFLSLGVLLVELVALADERVKMSEPMAICQHRDQNSQKVYSQFW